MTRSPMKLTKKSRENADMKDMITTLLNNDNESDKVDLAFQTMAKCTEKLLQAVDTDECMMEHQEVENRYVRVSRR